MGDEELMNSYMIRIDARYCPVKKVFCGFPMPRWLGQNTAAIPAHAAVLTNHQPNHVTLVARDLGCQRTFVLDKSTIAHPPATSLSRPSNNNNKRRKGANTSLHRISGTVSSTHQPHSNQKPLNTQYCTLNTAPHLPHNHVVPRRRRVLDRPQPPRSVHQTCLRRQIPPARPHSGRAADGRRGHPLHGRRHGAARPRGKLPPPSPRSCKSSS